MGADGAHRGHEPFVGMWTESSQWPTDLSHPLYVQGAGPPRPLCGALPAVAAAFLTLLALLPARRLQLADSSTVLGQG